MTTYHTFGSTRQITQAYEEDQDKEAYRLIGELLPEECLLLPSRDWDELLSNKQLHSLYTVEWEFDPATGFGKMKAYNIRGWELRAYTSPEIQRIERVEMDEDLRLRLAVMAL